MANHSVLMDRVLVHPRRTPDSIPDDQVMVFSEDGMKLTDIYGETRTRVPHDSWQFPEHQPRDRKSLRWETEQRTAQCHNEENSRTSRFKLLFVTLARKCRQAIRSLRSGNSSITTSLPSLDATR